MRSIVLFVCLAIYGFKAQELEDNIPENGTDVYNNKLALFSRIQKMKTIPEKTMKTLKMAVRLNVDSAKKENFGRFFGYIARFKKDYDNTTALISRFQKFNDAVSRVEQLNTKYDGEAHFELNEFADLSKEEFLSKYSGSFEPKNKKYTARDFVDFNNTRVKRSNLPAHFDYRDYGMVGGVRHQGQCGCCFIFASVEGVLGAYARKESKRFELSVQHILSCKRNEIGHNGCNGGNTADVLNYLSNNGAALEADAPFESSDGQEAGCPNAETYQLINGYKEVPRDEASMREAMYAYGTLVVGLDSNELQFYSRGVLRPQKSSYERIDHSVNLVGWGEENGIPYWIMKNSWGHQWGENGYARLERGVNAFKVESYVQVATRT